MNPKVQKIINDPGLTNTIAGATSLFLAQRYFRGKAPWGTVWKSRRARLVIATSTAGLGLLQLQTAAAKRREAKKRAEQLDPLRDLLFEALRTRTEDLFDPYRFPGEEEDDE